MTELDGRVAVVTGAASGIGLALARGFASHGMRIVMADLDAESLEEKAAGVTSSGADVLALPTDVADQTSVEELAAATFERFGTPHVLCNNAGVGVVGYAWETDPAVWDWVLKVDVWGVINGLNAFVPAMVENDEGHVVNTASMAGLLSSPGFGAYAAAKFAVVGITDSLHQDLLYAGSKVRASVLCPNFVKTRGPETAAAGLARLDLSARARPGDAAAMEIGAALAAQAGQAMDPGDVARMVVEAIQTGRFWILTEPDRYAQELLQRARQVVSGEPPSPFRYF